MIQIEKKTLQTVKLIREKLPKNIDYYDTGLIDILAIVAFTVSGIYLAKNGAHLLAKL